MSPKELILLEKINSQIKDQLVEQRKIGKKIELLFDQTGKNTEKISLIEDKVAGINKGINASLETASATDDKLCGANVTIKKINRELKNITRVAVSTERKTDASEDKTKNIMAILQELASEIEKISRDINQMKEGKLESKFDDLERKTSYIKERLASVKI